MRVDKYLKVSRIIKRRTIAKEACDAGRITLNGKVAKASDTVKPGDMLEVEYANRVTKYEILEIKEHLKKEESKELYRIV